MTTLQFFKATLLLPLLVGASAGLIAPNSLLALSLVYGGLPYIVVAVTAFFAIGRAGSMATLLVISLAMPVVLASLLSVVLGVLAVAALLIGYGYVLAVWFLYVLARKASVVRPLPEETPLPSP